MSGSDTRTAGPRRGLGLLVVTALLATGLVLAGGVTAPAQAAEFYPVPAGGAYTLDGRGYGHGHGMSQYGSQGAALQGLGAAEILAFYYPGTTQTGIGNPTLRVQLTATATGDIRLDTTAGLGMTVRDTASGAAASGPTGAYRVVTSGDVQTVYRFDGSSWVPFPLGSGGPTHRGPIEFSTADGVTVTERGGNARNYRGSIQVVRANAATSVAVNHVRMQDYLLGVVPRESPAWFQPAALQAQSVAARSYAWWDAQTPSSSAWDICDTTSCQVYGGREVKVPGKDWEKLEPVATTDAVRSTAGIALFHAGRPAFTQFSASNGGWASPGSQPYLTAFADPYDGIPTQNTHHRWTATLSAAYLQSTYPAIGTLTGIRITARDGRGEWGGRITSLELVGTRGTVAPSSARFNLKSTWWKPRGATNPIGDVNTVETPSTGWARLQGWTLDPDTTDPIAVHAYVDGAWGGAFTADVPRPDVAAAYPGTGDRHGFDIRLNLGQGKRTVCLYAINVGAGDANTTLGCRQVQAGSVPIGDLNSVTVTQGRARLQGWALDGDTADPIAVHAYVNGTWVGQTTANVPRPDVGSAYPAAGPNHGFDLTVGVSAGRNTVCLYAVDPLAGSHNPELACRVVQGGLSPIGDVNGASVLGARARVTGWAIDPDTADPISVHVYVDGRWGTAVTADVSRADVGRAYPASGPRHGFVADVAVGPGVHRVCAYGINVLGGDSNPLLGCATVDVPATAADPLGNVDGVTARAGGMTVSGWAADPDVPGAAVAIHVYVDGRWGAAGTAGEQRADVGAAYPHLGPARGYTVPLTAVPGRHTVCVYAINQGAGTTNPLLGCRAVDVSG